jgi:hypothetical protein
MIEKKYLELIYTYFQTSEIEFIKLAGDASSRIYYQVSVDQKDFIVCVTDEENKTQNEDFIFWCDKYAEHKIKVPQIYFFEKGLIIQECIGKKTLLNKQAQMSIEQLEAKYFQGIDLMLKIHSIDQRNINRDIPAFDFKKLDFEVDFAIKHFLTGILNIKSTEQEKIKQNFHDLIAKILEYPKVITHRDYHSKNLMLSAENELCVIDFQDTMMGLPQYDLCSLLDDCYTALDGKLKIKLIKYYWEKSIHQNYFSSFDDFMKMYNYVKIQRLFKAIGSFSYHWNAKKNPFYLKYIGHAMEKIKLTSRHHDDFSELRRNLFENYYAN